MYDIQAAQAFIEKMIKEGRGQNEGENYRSWIYVHQVSTWGLNNRPCGLTIKREYQLRTNQEYYYFQALDLYPSIVDIREHFPIIDIEESISIAEALNIRHPTEPNSNQPSVLTVEFFVTFEEELRVRFEAHLLRSKSMLEKRAAIEVIAIIHEYFARRHIPLKIAVEIDTRSPLIKTLEVLKAHYDLTQQSLSKVDIRNAAYFLTHALINKPQALRQLCDICDARFGLEPGSSLAVAHHLIARRYWQVDLAQPIDTGKPFTLSGLQAEDAWLTSL